MKLLILFFEESHCVLHVKVESTKEMIDGIEVG
jgi:hypothetical protein